MHARRETAAHEHEVARLRLAARLTALQLREQDRAHAAPSTGAEHGRSRQHRNARAARSCSPRTVLPRAHIRDAGDEHSRPLQLERHRVCLITCGDHHGARARQYCIAVEPGARRAGQHDSRPVVARKHQRALEGSGGEHHLAGAHLPLPFARHVGARLGEVVGEALVQSQQVVREVAECGGTGQERHARIRGERRDRLREPLPGGSPVDSQACAGCIGEQRAAQLVLLVAEDDARAGACRGRGRGESRRPPTHDEHVAVRVARGVAIGIRERR